MMSVSQKQKQHVDPMLGKNGPQVEGVVDPKTLVTPFAFEIAPKVLYTPLASPLKRGLAMLVDGLLITVLAEQAGWVFILLVGLTLLIQRKSRQLGQIFKWGLYLSMFVMMLWVTVGNLLPFTEQEQENSREESGFTDNQIGIDAIGQFISYMPNIIRFSRCENINCAETELDGLLVALSASKLPVSEQQNILNDAVDDIFLTEEDKSTLKQLIARNLNVLNNPAIELKDSNADSPVNIDASIAIDNEELGLSAMPGLPDKEQIKRDGKSANNLLYQEALDEQDAEDDSYSLVAWAKGILNDLGLGFGWAAFYFTVFTAWFDGQTLGKKLFGIRVIQLDGTKLSLWDAFGRYGGYGAGFATGLLGFLQIYWDANRQAIQDKISATVVIDTKKERVMPVKVTDEPVEFAI